MRAVWITRHGSPDALEVRESAMPTPGPGEVRISVRAAGLNFADVMARMGLYPDAPATPCVVGYEAAGVVDALGEGVKGLAVGDRVVALCRFGAHAEAVCVPVDQVFLLPEAMSFEEAAALPVNYLTAYHMLFRVGSLGPGQRVLIHMAAGGVGLAALQLCQTVGDVTTFGTASGSKHEAIRAAGCTYPIDYRRVDYAEEVRRHTGDEGVDLVLDALGGRDWRTGYSLLRPAGILVAFGFANLAVGERRSLARLVRQMLRTPRFSPVALMGANRAVAGVNMGQLWGEQAMFSAAMARLLEFYAGGLISPQIDTVFEFEQAGEAHRRLQQRLNVGKVLLVPS